MFTRSLEGLGTYRAWIPLIGLAPALAALVANVSLNHQVEKGLTLLNTLFCDDGWTDGSIS